METPKNKLDEFLESVGEYVKDRTGYMLTAALKDKFGERLQEIMEEEYGKGYDKGYDIAYSGGERYSDGELQEDLPFDNDIKEERNIKVKEAYIPSATTLLCMGHDILCEANVVPKECWLTSYPYTPGLRAHEAKIVTSFGGVGDYSESINQIKGIRPMLDVEPEGISDLKVGDKIQFAGHDWTILKPEEGLLWCDDIVAKCKYKDCTFKVETFYKDCEAYNALGHPIPYESLNDYDNSDLKRTFDNWCAEVGIYSVDQLHELRKFASAHNNGLYVQVGEADGKSLAIGFEKPASDNIIEFAQDHNIICSSSAEYADKIAEALKEEYEKGQLISEQGNLSEDEASL